MGYKQLRRRMAIKYGREGGTLFVMQTIYQFEQGHACNVNSSFDAKTDTNSGLTNGARGLKHGRLSADWAGVTPMVRTYGTTGPSRGN